MIQPATQSLTFVNEHLKFQKVNLIDPATSFYLHLAAEVDRSRAPFFFTSSKSKKRLIAQCRQWCAEIQKEIGVISAVVFKASLIPPGRGKFLEQRLGKVYIAKFDLAILIETTDLETIRLIQGTPTYQQMERAIKNISTYTHFITARNIRRIDAVNHEHQGVFLFNYFFADSTEQNLDVWEYTAGWFQQETGLDNSTVLLPEYPEDSQYSIINHCRWNKMMDILPSLIFKKTFHTFVLANFEANHVAAMPILYKLA